MKKINNILKKLTNPLLILSLISIVIIFTADTFIMDTAKQVKAVAISASILAFHMLVILVLDLLIAKKRLNGVPQELDIVACANDGWDKVKELEEKNSRLSARPEKAILSLKAVRKYNAELEEKTQSLTNRLRERLNEACELEQKMADMKSTISYLVRKDEASEETIELLKTAVKIAEQELNAVKHDIEISNGEEVKQVLASFQCQLCEIDACEITEQLIDLAIEFNQQKNPKFKTLIDSFGYDHEASNLMLDGKIS